jgi:hypothetical protein
MKNRIIRTLFWFSEDEDDIQSLNEQFYSLAYLFNKLLNETYQGPRMIFVNFDFYSNKVYDRFPVLPKGKPYYKAGYLTFYGILNYEEFLGLSDQDKIEKVWALTYQYFQESATHLKNDQLLAASKYAYEKGKEIGYKTDLEVFQSDLSVFDQLLKASIWVVSDSEGMKANFVLSMGDKKVYEKIIGKTKKGVGLFYDTFKSIISVGNIIIIKSKDDLEGYPISITLEKEDLKL